MTMKQKIGNIRFGHIDIKSLTDTELEEIMDYYLPEDIIEIIIRELGRRRKENLEK